MDLESGLTLSFEARLPFDTLDIVVFYILPMQDYITFEMTEMVSLFPFALTLP